MLKDISSHVVNFRALDDTVKKPDVAVDYRDLDYENKLDFVDGVEPPLQYLTNILAKADELIIKLEAEFKQAVAADDDHSATKITEINCTLRDDEDL
jgi:hypothetical protein